MPAFDVSVDFEVFCSECGAGICNHCDTGHTKGRGLNFISVEVCRTCKGRLEDKIQSLEGEIKQLHNRLEQYE